MIANDKVFLLTDAEICKDIPEDFVSGNFTNNRAEVVDGFADVLGSEVGWEAGGETVTDTEEGGAGVGEGLDVSLVGDEGGVTVCEEVLLGLYQDFAQIGEAEAGFC